MKRLLLGLSIVIGAWMLSPTPDAQAWSWGWSNNSHKAHKAHKTHKTHKTYKTHKTHKTHESRAGVPELDPSAAGSAMVLLLGGMAYIASRRREEDVA
jgi:hypothetical protein